ncbi:MAG: phosphomethylpyrimidine synthase ThiC [Candidatus Altiarchaeota archaeon]|nr:phosphomethylpyrimidine synthase ThiC [Candidatus Altiarchaeota archaeon]
MLQDIAERENIPLDALKRNVERGWTVPVKNARRDIRGIAIGNCAKVKINANIGTSPDLVDVDRELEKAKTAISHGADTLMDLSIGGDLDSVRRTIIRNINVPLGTVPVYQTFLEERIDMSAESLLNVIEKHCRDGVDFLTLHCGITKEIVEGLDKRLIPITSRGGSFLAAWMVKNRQENPLYEQFDEVLEIVKEYDVVISLGDALRPACINDATDAAQIRELINLGELTKKARNAGVPVIIEGPGHVPLDQIEMNVLLEKRICDNAPLYVLGPLVTDIAIGYDHITGAIGGAVAAMHGADFLCYVTPSEHLGLPTNDNVREGVVASKIAAHAADIVRFRDDGRDYELSKARKELDWNRMFELCIDKEVRKEHPDLADRNVCTMCGKYCALRILREYLGE